MGNKMNMPYCFTIKCAPSKIKYSCGYPAGFLEMARSLLVGGDINASIVHVCGGMAHTYNNGFNWGYGSNDKRIDINPDVKPDLLMDVRNWGRCTADYWNRNFGRSFPFASAIIDRDYDLENAARHKDVSTWPSNLRQLAMNTFELIHPGHYVGVLDFGYPNLPKEKYRQVFNVSILTTNQKIRQFSVWQEKNCDGA